MNYYLDVFNVLLKTHSPTKKDKRVKAKNM